MHHVLFDFLGAPALEGVLFGAQVVEAATQRPHVHLRSEADFFQNEFGRRVVHMTAKVIFLEQLFVVVGHADHVELHEPL